jgi:hypothetical protein
MAKNPKPIIRIHNIETDEIIDREMTAAEYAEWQLTQPNEEALEAEIIAKANAKTAIFERIGLTADELKTILG